jgi:midasin
MQQQQQADGEGQAEPEAEQVPLPELLQRLERRLCLPRAADLASHLTATLGMLAGASGEAQAQLAPAAASLAPLLRLLLCTLRQLGLQYLAVHKATAKLCYIAASLFAGLVQEGFCMPKGQEGEAEEGAEGKTTDGTGLGEGDTTGAKDISNEVSTLSKQYGGVKQMSSSRVLSSFQPTRVRLSVRKDATAQIVACGLRCLL